MEFDLNNLDRLIDYVKQKDMNKLLEFYKVDSVNEYIEKLKILCLNKDSIVLVADDNSKIKGFILGKIDQDSSLNSKIGSIIYTLYDDINIFEDLIKQYERTIKMKNCKFVKIYIPNFQSESLKVLASHGFIEYKVEMEKEI